MTHKRKAFKPKRNTPKSDASTAMSRYIRLRDALAYCNENGIDVSQFSRPEDIIGECCTCGKVGSWCRMDAGHYKGRGIGGGSGTYFDERNVHLQCKQCNAFGGGKPKEHEEYILDKYGADVLADIERKHHMPIDMGDMAMMATERYYKDEYKKLLALI